MPRTRIKICGITDEQAGQAAAEAGADAVGLVFAERSVRHVTSNAATQIVEALPAFVEPVGLFVDRPASEIRHIADELNLRTVQLHGSESPEIVRELAGLRVIKALHFDPDHAEQELASWLPAPSNLAALLWDTPPESDAAVPGGAGETFNWEALADFLADCEHAAPPRPTLAGGLDLHNVGQAIELVRPYAVDVSSGVEARRGVKSPAKIAAFCQAVRRAEQA
jgi:phosphoribosylanthranilate isomerase